jgi:hypothetical protein
MTTTSYGSTIIAVNEQYQIELMPSGSYYPMLKSSDGSRFCYFRKGRNGQESRKTERGARKFIEEYAMRVSDK